MVCMKMSLCGERLGPVHPLWASGCAAPLTRLLMLLLHVVCLALLQTLRMFVFLRLPRRALVLQVVVPLCHMLRRTVKMFLCPQTASRLCTSRWLMTLV